MFIQYPARILAAFIISASMCLSNAFGETTMPDNLGGGTGSTYYVDVNTGNDGNNGLSEGAAWASFAYAISQVQAGDTVLIKDGDYYSSGNDQYKNWEIAKNG